MKSFLFFCLGVVTGGFLAGLLLYLDALGQAMTGM